MEFESRIFRDHIAEALFGIVRDQHRLTELALRSVPEEEREPIELWVKELRANFSVDEKNSLLEMNMRELRDALQSIGLTSRYVPLPDMVAVGPEVIDVIHHATHENALWVAIADRMKAPQGSVIPLNLTHATLDHVARTQPGRRNLEELYDRVDEARRISAERGSRSSP